MSDARRTGLTDKTKPTPTDLLSVARAGACFLMGDATGRMPGVAALQPARFALGLSA